MIGSPVFFAYKPLLPNGKHYKLSELIEYEIFEQFFRVWVSGSGLDAFDVDDAAARRVEPEPGEPDEHDAAPLASWGR